MEAFRENVTFTHFHRRRRQARDGATKTWTVPQTLVTYSSRRVPQGRFSCRDLLRPRRLPSASKKGSFRDEAFLVSRLRPTKATFMVGPLLASHPQEQCSDENMLPSRLRPVCICVGSRLSVVAKSSCDLSPNLGDCCSGAACDCYNFLFFPCRSLLETSNCHC